jgi:predicted nucleic acid-binding protein
MNGNNIVADTSLLINFFNGNEPAKKILQEQQIWISAITEIELLSHPKLKSEEVKLINSFLNECLILDLTKPVKQIAIKLRRKKMLKLPDAIIAATSIHLDFPLVTMDSDFNKIKNLNAVVLEL